MHECTVCNKLRRLNTTNNSPQCSCKNKQHLFHSNHPETTIEESQTILVQLLPEYQMNTIEIVLQNELCNRAEPGEVYDFVGQVEIQLKGESYHTFLVANNIRRHIRERVEINKEDFIAFSKKKNLMGILINSVFENIAGNELIKAGLLMAMFGGTEKYTGSVAVSDKIHVLIIGGAGLGKTKTLKDSAKAVTNSKYFTGENDHHFLSNKTTTRKKQHSTKCGIIKLAQNGLCCIDNLEEIRDLYNLSDILLNNTTVVATTRSKNNTFDSTKTIKENTNLPTDVLDCFNLTFVIKDTLTTKENYEISSKMLKRIEGSFVTNFNSSCTTETTTKLDKLFQKARNTHSFYKETDESVNINFIRGYIEYAKSHCKPRLSRESQEHLIAYARENKLTTKSLETLINITESNAKMHLMSTTDLNCAMFATKIFKETSQTKTVTKSKVKIEDALKNYRAEFGTRINKAALIKIIEETNDDTNVHKILDKLNYRGIIIRRNKEEFKIDL
ncbi:MCM8 [Enterospora canceri]|uniref:MCM8 n=1 Tax=Enterospora canceri TaxID=1081671 RepID=A0A1Y1S823_9MICR|nr:MCM8 [Enterospora canceri]